MQIISTSSFTRHRDKVKIIPDHNRKLFHFLMKGLGALLFIYLGIFTSKLNAQTFIHPGGLHSQADLDRMKTKVAAGEHPWIDGWNKLIADPAAQNTYGAGARANMGSSRQRCDADAHAAYLNAIRWYISGDTTYAACAVRICNAWSAVVNQVPTGTDIPGLSGIPVFDFALAAEVLRMYPGWSSADFNQFKNMMRNYFYPVCHDFLTNHNGTCITHWWANWDIANIGGVIATGVLLDDTTMYNEGVNYFKNGNGAGSIKNAVYFIHPDGLGQWQETGRDQEHAQLGVGMMGAVCQVAWNQGLDLFSYDNNRLLAGAEYVAKTNLCLPVSYQPYNNCDNVNQRWVSINGIGRIDDRPVWELLYNHYAIRKGLNTPNVKAMAQVTRPEVGSVDHFGYGTLTFTLDAAASTFPPSPVPAAPNGLSATAGVSRVALQWTPSSAGDVQGYQIQRSTTAGGPYTTIASWDRNTYPQYTDGSVTNGQTYYYVVAAINQSGTSTNSVEVSAKPIAATSVLPSGWTRQDIGNYGVAGSAAYANISNNTFIVSGAGAGIGGTSDGGGFTYGAVAGDATITARLIGLSGPLSRTGIMIRESMDPSAKAFVMKLGDAGSREAAFGYRTTNNTSMTWVGGNDYTWLPAWFRLQRAGNTITAFESSDGITWFVVGSATTSLNNICYIGLVNCSGNTSSLNTATFDNVTVVGTSTSAPATPAGLTIKPGNTQDTLKWSRITDASSYGLKRATASGGPYVTIAPTINDTTYIDTALVNGTTYYYVVSAANLNGESDNSAEVSATPQLAVPVAPIGVSAASPSANNINLTWTQSLSATSYNVKRAMVNGGPYNTIASPSTTSYTDADITNGTTYYYVITAVNAVGESIASFQVSATPGQLSYWKFDETIGSTATDSWGNRDATLIGGISWAAGIQNNSVVLDGASGYASVPKSLMNGITNFTIASWIKVNANTAWERLFDFGTGSTNYMFLSPVSGSNNVRYAITTGSGEQQINSTGLMSLGTWHHVAVTQSGNLGILYIDGVEAGRNANLTLTPSSLGNTTTNYIGKSQFAADPLLNGAVDEFRIYSKALSATEILAMVNEHTPPAAPLNVVATDGNNKTFLTWKSSARAISYNVKRSIGVDSNYIFIGNVTDTVFVDTTAFNCNNYYYVVTALNNSGEGSPSSSANPRWNNKLAGTLIGTTGSWNNNSATTKAAAVDGNLTTFFDAAQGNGAWVGYDLGAGNSAILTLIRYAPRSGYTTRMTGGAFQGANTADFTDAVTLFTVTGNPVAGVLTTQKISSTTAFRYFRYLSPNGGSCNVAEIEFWGIPAVLPAITSNKNINGITDSSFRYVIDATNQASGFTAGNLPLGLQLDNCTGIISGIPSVSGIFKVPISITNYFGIANDTLVISLKRNQLISFNTISTKVAGDLPFVAGATASSGLPIDYESSDTSVAEVINGNVYIKKDGSAIITASQAGDTAYYAAVPAQQVLTILPLNVSAFYKDGDNHQLTNNTISPYLQLANNSDAGVAYGELTARYWLTVENFAGINAWVDYAAIGNGKVNMRYVQLSQPRSGAYGYVEYSFGNAGSLAAHGNSGAIQTRIANVNWALLNEQDDYSYQNSSSYTANSNITLYRNGVLVWGTEPVAVAPVTEVKVYAQNPDAGNTNNTIRTYLKLSNEGNQPLLYKDLTARYWFTKDGLSALNYAMDYAVVGNSKVNGKFVSVSPALSTADTYFELKIDSSVGTLYPLSNTGNVQYRIYKSDWSLFNKANDYSYQPYSTTMAENNQITVYYKGELIYGREPSSISPLSTHLISGHQTTVETGNAAIYPNPVTAKRFYIKPVSGVSRDVLVKVADAAGSIIYSKVFKNNNGEKIEIELNGNIVPGIYFVQLNGESAKKIIVQ